jgi:Fe-S-cluster containining protein
LPGNSSDARVSDLDNITIDQFSRPIDNITLKENNIAKYQQVSLLCNLVLFGDRCMFYKADTNVCQLNHLEGSSAC